jgi:hypothetical protein
MRTLLFLSSFLFFAMTTPGYSTNKYGPVFIYNSFGKDTNSLYKKNQLKVTPFRIARFEYSGIELSYERRHTQRFSTQASVRYLTDPFHMTGGSGYKGAGCSLEEKFFLTPLKFFKLYLSMEGLFDKFTAVEQAHFVDGKNTPDSTRYTYLDKFTIVKQAVSLNLKCGIQLFICKKIVVDVGIGPGLKYRNVIHKNRSVPSDVLEPWIGNASTSEGEYFVANCSVGIKVGYAF